MIDPNDIVHTVDPKRYPNPWHPDDPVRFSQTMRAWRLDYNWDEIPEDVNESLQRGRLSMSCPYCKYGGPAGPWCPKCGRMITYQHWFKGTAEDSPPAPGKRRRGRPSKADVEAAGKVCDCGE
jgi:hypothetical protein